MPQYLSSFFNPYLRPAAILCLCFAALCGAPAVLALTRVDLYQTTVPTADRSEAAQTVAFQNAMKIVLVRLTGRHSTDDDPALAPLISNARRYVQQFRAAGQGVGGQGAAGQGAAGDGQVWVAFDGAAIERWLTQNGQPVWGRERPTTVVLLAVQTGAQTGTVVTAADTSDLKQSIDAQAAYRGLPLQWPSAADVQKYRLDYAAVASGSTSALADIAKRMGGDAVLIGRSACCGPNANVRWTHQFQDRSSEYSGTLEGVERSADLYASLFAASGNVMPVDIEVTGVRDLRDYASVQSYLESLTFISHVSVEALTADTVRFRLATRSAGESLQRALSLNGRLQPMAPGDNGIQRFQLRR
jgi:hypothetical protein